GRIRMLRREAVLRHPDRETRFCRKPRSDAAMRPGAAEAIGPAVEVQDCRAAEVRLCADDLCRHAAERNTVTPDARPAGHQRRQRGHDLSLRRRAHWWADQRLETHPQEVAKKTCQEP